MYNYHICDWLLHLRIQAVPDTGPPFLDSRRFIIKEKPGKTLLTVFRLLATALVFIGAIMSADAVWNTADVVQGLMVVVNVLAILLLGKRALLCLEDYISQRKAGKDPHYIAAECGIREETDFWKR